SLRGEHTIILSTHILPEAQMLCDRIVIINEGRVAAVDRPENLTARLRRSQQVRLEVRGPAEEVERQLRGLSHVLQVRREQAADHRRRSTEELTASRSPDHRWENRMRATLAIAERELKAYFASPVGYVVIAGFLFLAGYLFYLPLAIAGDLSLRRWTYNIVII